MDYRTSTPKSVIIAGLLAVMAVAFLSEPAEALDTTPPSAPEILFVEEDYFNAIVAWENGEADVVRYNVFVNGRLATTVDHFSGATDHGAYHNPKPSESTGSWWFQVQAVDSSGNVSVKSAPTRFDFDFPAAPSVPTGFDVEITPERGCVDVSWTGIDSVEPVQTARFYSNGEWVGSTVTDGGADSTTICDVSGTSYLQMQAFTNLRGSYKTFPVRIDANPTPPVPKDLAAAQGADAHTVHLTWTPIEGSFDIIVLDRLVEVGRIEATVGGIYELDLSTSSIDGDHHWFQLQTEAADGTRSVRTAPILYVEPNPTTN